MDLQHHPETTVFFQWKNDEIRPNFPSVRPKRIKFRTARDTRCHYPSTCFLGIGHEPENGGYHIDAFPFQIPVATGMITCNWWRIIPNHYTNGISDGDFDAVGANSCRLQALTNEMERIRATLDFKDCKNWMSSTK